MRTGIEAELSESIGLPANPDELDIDLERGKKRHRNLLSKLDHAYSIISHPFVVACGVVVFGIGFFLSRYLSILHPESEMLRTLSSDIKLALSYIITIVITSIFTEYIHRRRN
jgi:hypothetical protein